MNTTKADEDQTVNLVRYSIFIVEGLVLVVSNLLITATVARHEALYDLKEYVFIAGLSLVDGIDGIAAISAGTHRIILILREQHLALTSRRSCFFVPSNFIWCFSHGLQGLMLAVVAIDRLISVYDPLRYINLTATYAMRFVGGAIAVGIFELVVAAYQTWDDIDLDQKPECLYGFSVDPDWHKVIKQTRLWGTITNLVLYVFVLYFYNKNSKVEDETETSQSVKRRVEQQRHVTKSLAISWMFNLLFFGLPTLIQTTLFYLEESCYFFCPYAYIIMCINPILNLGIYVKRHSEIRVGIQALFSCKTMPVELQNWNA